MEATDFSEMLVPTYQATQRHTPVNFIVIAMRISNATCVFHFSFSNSLIPFFSLCCLFSSSLYSLLPLFFHLSYAFSFPPVYSSILSFFFFHLDLFCPSIYCFFLFFLLSFLCQFLAPFFSHSSYSCSPFPHLLFSHFFLLSCHFFLLSLLPHSHHC